MEDGIEAVGDDRREQFEADFYLNNNACNSFQPRKPPRVDRGPFVACGVAGSMEAELKYRDLEKFQKCRKI